MYMKINKINTPFGYLCNITDTASEKEYTFCYYSRAIEISKFPDRQNVKGCK